MSSAMKKISQQFLTGTSVEQMNFHDVCLELINSTSQEALQDTLLSLTIDHPLIKQYPVRLEYQRNFMRKLITALEACKPSIEISGNVYERHIQILQDKTGEDFTGKVFRHYFLDNGSVISVRDYINIVSDGTTGLHIWQAAHELNKWCFKNFAVLNNSTILELGSGVGFCGIAVSYLCNPQCYIFSDCHPAVMNALVENVKLNAGKESADHDFDPHWSSFHERVMWAGTLRETKVAIAHLPWTDILCYSLAPKIAPDFVIASDIVYDSRDFNILSQTIQEFVKLGSKVILACTDRKSGILQEFLKTLGALCLKVEEDETSDEHIIPNNDECVVKIYTVVKP